MKNYKLIVFLLFVSSLLLYSCSNLDKKINDANQGDIITVSKGEITKTSEIKEDNQYINPPINSPYEIDLLPLYLEGLKNNDPKIRLYSCYKMIEYYYNTEKHNEIKESLKALLNDNNISIRESTEFVLSLFEKSFNKEGFSKSPNGKYIAFYSFQETRYNDGICLIYYVEEDCIQAFDNSYISINGFSWSPDGNTLCIYHGGRTWSDISFIDLKANKTHTLNVYNYLYENQKELGYVLGQWERPDPSISFIEWSPDMKKVLLSYSFADDNMIRQIGLCVYSLDQEKIERIVKQGQCEGGNPSIEKPDDFMW